MGRKKKGKNKIEQNKLSCLPPTAGNVANT